VTGYVIRRMVATDDWEKLTALLHRAHAPLAARGLRYLASHQDVSVTRERAESGECYLAIEGEGLLGTVTVYLGSRESISSWYRREDVASKGQLAVEPGAQGRGIGRALMDFAESRALEYGATRIAIDTSEHATELIDTYGRRGYEVVDSVQWRETNYRSVILARSLSAGSSR
jgi:GNAT superfamily N-acetyltransferase